VWLELDKFLAQEFVHESGQKLRVDVTVVDSGGAHTEQVYRYAQARFGRRVFPIKGGSVTGRPLVERPSRHNRYRVPLFVLCVDTGKDAVLSRLRVPSPGPGYMHLPDWADEEYLAQLTAEKAIRRYVKGRGAVREWVKLRERNEALDLEAYALAALYILGQPFVNALAERADLLARPPEKVEAAAPDEQWTLSQFRTPWIPRRRGWLNRW
jgi:phage terminase large subunit GpA-like protein